jgi:hypothetical protein
MPGTIPSMPMPGWGTSVSTASVSTASVSAARVNAARVNAARVNAARVNEARVNEARDSAIQCKGSSPGSERHRSCAGGLRRVAGRPVRVTDSIELYARGHMPVNSNIE